MQRERENTKETLGEKISGNRLKRNRHNNKKFSAHRERYIERDIADMYVCDKETDTDIYMRLMEGRKTHEYERRRK